MNTETVADKPKYTPGPWEMNGPWDSDLGSYYAIDSGLQGVAIIYDEKDRTNAEADAILIAAAPDLLEALKDAISTLETSDHPVHNIDELRAVVRRAEGQVSDVR